MPFIGLAEAYALAAFRKAGVPQSRRADAAHSSGYRRPGA
jgi:hypothetical protein